MFQQKVFEQLKEGTSLVAQLLRIRLPMQGTRVRALVREDPTCSRATKPQSAESSGHHQQPGCASPHRCYLLAPLPVFKMRSGFPGGVVDKKPPANAGDTGSILVREDPTCCGATKPISVSQLIIFDKQQTGFLAALLRLRLPPTAVEGHSLGKYVSVSGIEKSLVE
ncbi:hypothetical protein J1605_001386 [Eschrichtius robustus]|uniref:Uncharacterized protein n=1 Tax=Eschrichtius robustus TaxID=9764 RepID=A0AB34I5E3_ESCRO|nr:hypothetical protein J1605_001386 [Eschrichtius robustus]